ncbi:MAG: hypothetical protein JST42_03355, partial [Bacteroidetes bacterium]|nr:hypothetical protein [Bacteroidota bacterium]
YIELNHNAWYTRLTALLDSVADPAEKLLAIFDYHINRQQVREHGGCPFIKANHEAGMSDPRVLEAIRQVKQQFRDMVKELVVNSGHKHLLTDDELTEMIYLAVEGGTTAASVFKNTTDLQLARQIIKKLI